MARVVVPDFSRRLVQRGAHRWDDFFSAADRLVRERGLFGLVDERDRYLTEASGDGNTNFGLHLRT